VREDAAMRERADEPFTSAYRVVLAISGPIMRTWSRLTVTGVEHLPKSGPTLLVANHDSYWDPIAIAVAAGGRRQIRALGKASIWKVRFVGRMMDNMGHIPVERGAGDTGAMDLAVAALAGGACIGVVPEGTRSLGRPLRARSGAGRLAMAVPGATVVCACVTGASDVVRVPKRPAVSVRFFPPAGGQLQTGESAADFSTRLLEEIRTTAPRDIPGRRRTAAKYRARIGD
jgi:1-acyl-sn-glycerol-3-phosphate acyltransferase